MVQRSSKKWKLKKGGRVSLVQRILREDRFIRPQDDQGTMPSPRGDSSGRRKRLPKGSWVGGS